MTFRYFVAILALFSVPLMALVNLTTSRCRTIPRTSISNQTTSKPGTGLTFLMGIESTFLGVSDNPVVENANKPIIRLVSSPDSTSERRPWRSIEDPERAGVFPFQPVNINPWPKNSSLRNPEVYMNSAHECDVMHVSAPYLDGDEVAAHFDADC